MKNSVSAVFVSKSKIFFIKRQNYLPAFPGYHASPGGKVDETDSSELLSGKIWPNSVPVQILHALIREIKEELGYDLVSGIQNTEVERIDDIGIAESPSFNPHRFKNYYIKITLNNEINFKVDTNEALFGVWKKPQEFLNEFYEGKILAVPPTITMLKILADNLAHAEPIAMSLPHNLEDSVPMFESIHGVRQFMPLSNTFPPANRTNAFIIGDDNQNKILVDPSPKDEVELEKFLLSVDRIGFDSIFLTHHHPDHYQFSKEIALRYKVGIELSAYTYEAIGRDYFKGIDIIIRKEGDIITKSLGEDIVVFEVPGHDEGQLALAPKNLSWFLVGDLIQTIGTVVIGAPAGGNMKKYFASLERVIALDPQNIIPSHGIILGGTHKLFETLKHRKAREHQIIELLKHHKSEEEILQAIYKDLSPKLIPYAKMTIEAHIEKIREENLV